MKKHTASSMFLIATIISAIFVGVVIGAVLYTSNHISGSVAQSITLTLDGTTNNPELTIGSTHTLVATISAPDGTMVNFYDGTNLIKTVASSGGTASTSYIIPNETSYDLSATMSV